MTNTNPKPSIDKKATRGQRVRKMLKWVLIVLIGLWIVAFILLDIVQIERPRIPPSLPSAETTLLPQGIPDGWGIDGRQWLYHVSQGTRIIPYEWLVSLEQPDISALAISADLFVDPEYMSHFGFLPGEAHESFNPDGLLPLGFAIEYDFNDPIVDKTYNAVGLTCSACHTGQLTYQGKAIRIEGGSASVDLRAFQSALGRAVLYTLKSPLRYGRFEGRVLGSDATAEQREVLKKDLESWLTEALAQNIQNEAQHIFKVVESGPGRTDALTLIGNRVFGQQSHSSEDGEASVTENLSVASAPVNFPPLWETSWYDWVQYNGSIRMVMVRNIGEALGVGARTQMDPTSKRYLESTVNVRNLHHIEDLLGGDKPFEGLKAPDWGDAVKQAGFPPLDEKLVAQGRKLYGRHCAKCHLPSPDILREDLKKPDSPYWTTASAPPYNRRFMRLKQVPLSRIGTDPAQATNFAFRTARLPAADEVAAYVTLTASKGLRLITEEIRERSYRGSNLTDDEIALWDRFRQHHRDLPDDQVVTAPLAYRARPLNGIWATPPYLHNGSVPTLRQLLSPVGDRSRTFRIGSGLYDPENAGLADTSNADRFLFDTRLPGNHNSGHEFRNLTLPELETAFGLHNKSSGQTRPGRWATLLGISTEAYNKLDADELASARRYLTETALRVRDRVDDDRSTGEPSDDLINESVFEGYKSLSEEARARIRNSILESIRQAEKELQLESAVEPTRVAEQAVAPNVGPASFTGVIGPLLTKDERTALIEFVKSIQ